ncbi:substrate-binding domain-containing protein [Paenibacillus sp. FSL H8-0537]|uniref:substrate-binding domain-containing protein n=1 Tax=Paenibacillus sp. FSL H8-0537 TaxID=2921399 RepID=UPI003100E3D4
MRKQKKITMQEIADRVGVSKYAVSKALSGKSGISAVTRSKIFEMASQLGYMNQKSAKKMPSSKQNEEEEHQIVGILIPNIRSQNKESGYWGKVLDGISKSLEAKGLGSVLISDDSPRNFNLVMKPEGLMGIIGVGLIATPMLVELRNKAIPFILVDHEDELLECDSIFMNNYDIIRKLVKFLIGKGHTQIQFIGQLGYSRSFIDRWSGFRSVMDESRLDYTPSEGLLKVKPTLDEFNLNLLQSSLKELEASRFPTAFVCANDQIALLAMNALQRLGKQVPEQCSLTGFDNNLEILGETPMITTVNAEKEALGIKAVELLQWRLENGHMPYAKILLQSDLIIRESVGDPVN